MIGFYQKSRTFSSLMGLILALAVVSRAWGEVGSIPEKNVFSPLKEGAASVHADQWPTTPAVRPLDGHAQWPGELTGPNGSVVQANYETPGTADPRTTPNATPSFYQPAEASLPPSTRDEAPQFLPPRSKPSSPTSTGSTSGLDAVMKTGGVLAVVLGLFCVVAWTMRRTVPKKNAAMPVDVIETLGRVPLAARQEAHLIRIGQKLLLVNITTDGARTLTEITDRAEVDRLTELCRRSGTGRATAALRQALGPLGGSRGEGRHA